MKIGKKIQWLRPYLDAAASYILAFPKLVGVSTKEPPMNQIATSEAVALCDESTGLYNIVLRTSYISYIKLRPLKRERKYYTKIYFLCNLAHELAHLDHWDHSPDHKLLEAKLTIVFMEILKSQGYIADENEYGPHQIN